MPCRTRMSEKRKLLAMRHRQPAPSPNAGLQTHFLSRCGKKQGRMSIPNIPWTAKSVPCTSRNTPWKLRGIPWIGRPGARHTRNSAEKRTATAVRFNGLTNGAQLAARLRRLPAGHSYPNVPLQHRRRRAAPGLGTRSPTDESRDTETGRPDFCGVKIH